MHIQAFWYYTVTEEIQRILGEAMPRFVFLNWAQIKKQRQKYLKTNKKSTNKQTKKRQQWQQKNLHQK